MMSWLRQKYVYVYVSIIQTPVSGFMLFTTRNAAADMGNLM